MMSAWREMAGGTEMSRRDREDLMKLVRRRKRMAKAAAASRSADLLADFEQQLSAIHSYDQDATWRQLNDESQAFVDEADRRVAERCRELGIPTEFRPRLAVAWYSRGENAVAGRRAELRVAARAKIDALERAARGAIQQQSVDIQTALMAGGLETTAAKAFLESMPTAEALMPPLDARAIEAAIERDPRDEPVGERCLPS